MGMAGGAHKGDMDRARIALQAASIANSRRAQEAQQQHQRAVLAEQARQADMADARANRALDIQESRQQGQPETPERKSPYSVFSNADLLAAARQRAQDGRLSALEGQNNVLGQFQQVVDTEKRQQAAKRAHGQSTMAALMKMAMANGGTAPMAAINFANRQFGFDGKTRAIGGAGFTQNGDWFVDFLQKDQNGQLSRQTSTMPFEQQGQVFYGQAGIFDNADRAAWRKGMLDRKYSTQEVNTFSGLDATAMQGLDAAGLQRLEQGFVDPANGGDWKKELAFRKQELMEAKFAQKLGQQSLDAAQKYALYHFNDFGSPRKATQDDVDNGLAQKVGDIFMPTPKMKFDEAVQFYKENMGGEDPATSAAGRDPTAVSTQGGDNGNPPPANGQPQDGNGNPPPDNGNPPNGNGQPPNGNEPPPGDNAVPAPEQPGAPKQPEQPQQPGQPGGEQPIQAGEVNPPQPPEQPEQQELDFGGGGGGAPAEGGEGGEGGAPAEGGEGGAPAGGGEGGGGGEEGGGGAPPPPQQTDDGGEPPSNGMASGALNAEQLEMERRRKKWQNRVRKR